MNLGRKLKRAKYPIKHTRSYGIPEQVAAGTGNKHFEKGVVVTLKKYAKLDGKKNISDFMVDQSIRRDLFNGRGRLLWAGHRGKVIKVQRIIEDKLQTHYVSGEK